MGLHHLHYSPVSEKGELSIRSDTKATMSMLSIYPSVISIKLSSINEMSDSNYSNKLKDLILRKQMYLTKNELI